MGEKMTGSTSSNNNSYGDVNDDDQMNMNMDMDMMMMDDDVRRGPWTVEEDFSLINYIAHHGEGRWNSLARCAGLKRTGKSCRLRWLNYLRPDVRRGNITLEEQLLILELHSRWGNRWSKIAQHLPGRTDNEIKNYWRTRVQKHAKQLKCDVNSKQFKDTMRYLWMPRLVERIQAASATTGDFSCPTVTDTNNPLSQINIDHIGTPQIVTPHPIHSNVATNPINPSYPTENSTTTAVSPVISDLTDCYYPSYDQSQNQEIMQNNYQIGDGFDGSLISPMGYFNQGFGFDAAVNENNQWSGGDFSDNLWNVEDVLYLQQQFKNM